MKYDNSLSVVYDDSLDTDWCIDLDEKMIKIRGFESIIPGILDKTIKAIEICLQEFKFDILVRSNMSTVIDTFELSSQLQNVSGPIYGGHDWNLTWYDPKYNITREFRDLNWGLRFVSGTSIVLSRDMCEYIISNKTDLNTNIIDDVAIGLLLKNVQCNTFRCMLRNTPIDITEKACFYRCKNNVNSMRQMYHILLQNGHLV